MAGAVGAVTSLPMFKNIGTALLGLAASAFVVAQSIGAWLWTVTRLAIKRIEIVLRYLARLTIGVISYGVRDPVGAISMMIFVRDLLMQE